MKIQESTIGPGIHVLELIGPLSGATAEGVKETVERVFQGNARHIIINLAGVPFIDSRGLSALAAVLRTLNADGRTMGLVGLQSQPRLVFELTGFDKFFQIFQDVTEASTQLIGEPV